MKEAHPNNLPFGTWEFLEKKYPTYMECVAKMHYNQYHPCNFLTKEEKDKYSVHLLAKMTRHCQIHAQGERWMSHVYCYCSHCEGNPLREHLGWIVDDQQTEA